ncbi:MAG: ComF family protein [Deltaproteobacteria bacterium]|nr:ComF family protein [Deltaproteobacteria bacterium]
MGVFQQPDRKNILSSFLNLLFPPLCPLCEAGIKEDAFCAPCLSGSKRMDGPVCLLCGRPFASEAGIHHTCADCLKKNPPFVKARSAFYYEGTLLSAIHRFKYGGNMAFLKPLSLLLSHAMTLLNERPDIIVPVPLHKERLKKRGFNQSLLLARELAKGLSVEVDCMNLKRTLNTLPQVDLKEKERVINVKGAFTVKDPSKFKGKRVLLVDDVFTTGATVRECAKVLKKAGAEVFAVTLARVGHM